MSPGGRRGVLQGRYCFLFRPPDERKNLDWSEVVNYLIHPPTSSIHWSATCLSGAQRSRDSFELFLEETLRSFEENSIRAKEDD